MPYARISLLRGRAPDALRAISDGVHRALHEAFDVPARDRFQVIHQLDPGELVFDRDYLGGPRSDGFVLALDPATGAPDTAFGDDGYVWFSADTGVHFDRFEVRALHVFEDGRILAGGNAHLDDEFFNSLTRVLLASIDNAEPALCHTQCQRDCTTQARAAFNHASRACSRETSCSRNDNA